MKNILIVLAIMLLSMNSEALNAQFVTKGFAETLNDDLSERDRVVFLAGKIDGKVHLISTFIPVNDNADYFCYFTSRQAGLLQSKIDILREMMLDTLSKPNKVQVQEIGHLPFQIGIYCSDDTKEFFPSTLHISLKTIIDEEGTYSSRPHFRTEKHTLKTSEGRTYTIPAAEYYIQPYGQLEQVIQNLQLLTFVGSL